MPVEKHTDSLGSLVARASASKLVFLVFSTKDCHYCVLLRKLLPWFADTYRDQIEVIMVDVRKHPHVVTTYGIRGVPTLQVYANNEKLLSKSGKQSKKNLKEMLHIAKSKSDKLFSQNETHDSRYRGWRLGRLFGW